MALIITHQFVSSKPDGNDSTLIRPSNWNANHIITGTVDETMLSLSDITTANVSTSMHGFVPKLPNDSTKFLNGVGMYSTPAGGGDVTQAGNNDFIGVNNFASRTQLGSIPLCDNALLTIYQTMDGSMNTSMVDSIATASGTVDYITNLNVITHGQGTIGNILTGIYVRNDIDTGTTASSYGIWIDSPQVGASVASTVGLLISAQDGGIATNLFSMVVEAKTSSRGYLHNPHTINKKQERFQMAERINIMVKSSLVLVHSLRIRFVFVTLLLMDRVM